MEKKIRHRDKNIKLKHIEACLLEESQYEKSAGFEKIEMINQSTASLNLEDIDLSTKFLGKFLSAPLMIAPMTGGIEKGQMLNERWAKAAQYFNIPFGVGSQRLALEDSNVGKNFKVRRFAPDILLFANIGAAQLAQQMNEEHTKRAVDMIEADAIFIHINPLQEACQENGDTSFVGILKAIEKVVKFLKPFGTKIFAREVCFGFSEQAARDLINTGVDGLDCAGAGGTSWVKVEGLCSLSKKYKNIAKTFGEYGIPTTDSIRNVRLASKDIPLIATGGLRTGLDVAKALSLGANLGAMAYPMLKAALLGEKELFEFIEKIILELKISLFAAGLSQIQN